MLKHARLARTSAGVNLRRAASRSAAPGAPGIPICCGALKVCINSFYSFNDAFNS